MKYLCIVIFLTVFSSALSAKEREAIFDDLPQEKVELLLVSDKFNNSILRNTKHRSLNEDNDLLAIDTASSIYHGLWTASYKQNKYKKISFNIPQYGPYTEDKKLLYVATGASMKGGQGYSFVSIITVHADKSAEIYLFAGSYMYQESEWASCVRGGRKLEGSAQELKEFKVYEKTKLKIVVSYYERNCKTNTLSEISKTYDIQGNEI